MGNETNYSLVNGIGNTAGTTPVVMNPALSGSNNMILATPSFAQASPPAAPGAAPAVAPAAAAPVTYTPTDDGGLKIGDRVANWQEIQKYNGVDTAKTLADRTLALDRSLAQAKANNITFNPDDVRQFTDSAQALGGVETTELDNKGRDIRNRKGEEEITNMVFDRWGKVGAMALGLFDKILQAAWMSHRAGVENDLVELANKKEDNRADLQWELVKKQSTLQESAMRYDYQKARVSAGTEKYKAKLAADVKKAKIKQDSLKDLFLPRNKYNYGYAFAK